MSIIIELGHTAKDDIEKDANLAYYLLYRADSPLSFQELSSSMQMDSFRLSSALGWLLRGDEIVVTYLEGTQYFQVKDKAIATAKNYYLPREQEIYLKFKYLITQHCHEHLNVSDYAKMLCISSKYLSSSVRKASGKAAKKWIEEATVKEIERDLRTTCKSIKEISDSFQFPTATFFCKCFKQQLGMSPGEYRKLLVKE